VTTRPDQDHKAFVFLMTIGELRRMFDDWPAHMHLAVCLKDDGECRMLVYREEEGAGVLPRLRRVLGLRMSEICFFPELEGFATRKLLYSDEKQLLALVRNSPEIVEEAADYSVNYSFALEEGLDPVRFLQSPEELIDIPARRKRPVEVAPKPAPPDPVVTPRAAPKRDAGKVALPRFMQVDLAPRPGPGFQSVEEIRVSDAAPQHCVIHPARDGWVSIDLPGCIGGQVVVSNPGCIFVRDDRRMIAIHSDLIAGQPRPLPGRIVVGLKYLPAGLHDILSGNVGEARLSFEHGFLFVTLKSAPREEGAPKPAAKPVAGRGLFGRLSTPWRMWAAGIATVFALFMVGMQFGAAPVGTSGEATGAIDWSQFQTGSLDPAPTRPAQSG